MKNRYIIYVHSELGGVNNVTSSLAVALQSLGCDVCIVRSIKELFSAWLQNRNRVFISSLGFGLFNPLFKKSIYIIHGFPMVDVQNFVSKIILINIPRIVKIFNGRLVAVSHLTRAVYERIYGIKVDCVIHNGISNDFFTPATSYHLNKEKLILYVGRLVEGKGITEIISAFSKSNAINQGYKMMFIGSGPLQKNIELISKKNKSIILTGEVLESAKVKTMMQSEIFLSLNSFEPMGVVFAEALACNCKIIAPHCGGYREFIPKAYQFFGCDPFDINSIVAAIDSAIIARQSCELDHNWRNYFNYQERVAKEYLRVID